MKNCFKIIMLIGSLFVMLSCKTVIEPMDLGQGVFEAFKNKDVDLALEYILYEDDYRDVFSNSTLSNEKKESLLEKHCNNTYVLSMKNKFINRFTEIIKEGEEVGIEWNDIQFKYIEGPDYQSHYGTQSDEIYLFFSYNSRLFKITLDDCCKCSRGWLMSDEPRFTECSKVNELNNVVN